MSGVARNQEINNNSEFEKSRNGTSSQYADPTQTFTVELTVSQANAIMKLLPPRYSIHIDRTFKAKRTVKRKFTLENKNYKSIHEGSQEPEVQQMMEEQVYGPIPTVNYDDMTKKCQKILNMLRKNKNAWPFKQPVDPIAMGIPQYREIITNPMDLKTIGQNLSSNKYSTISQFYADIYLVIKNSYTFNKHNEQFYAITSEFEKYFEKIKTEPVLATKPQTPVLKKIPSKPVLIQKKESENKSNDLAKRKQVASKLKYLPRQQLTQLIQSMNVGQSSTELNLQTLPMQKIKLLQDYLQKKQNASNSKANVTNKMEDQSSFQSDSDS